MSLAIFDAGHLNSINLGGRSRRLWIVAVFGLLQACRPSLSDCIPSSLPPYLILQREAQAEWCERHRDHGFMAETKRVAKPGDACGAEIMAETKRVVKSAADIHPAVPTV